MYSNKFVVLSNNNLLVSDQVNNSAQVLWKNEETLLESKQFVLRVNEQNAL